MARGEMLRKLAARVVLYPSRGLRPGLSMARRAGVEVGDDSARLCGPPAHKVVLGVERVTSWWSTLSLAPLRQGTRFGCAGCVDDERS